MDASRMKALERAAVDLATKNHGQFLQEALQVLRDPQVPTDKAPIEALRLLVALQGSPYADRRDPKAALGAVGAWLEAWLLVHPGISAAELARDLGWLVRLSRIHDTGPGGAAPGQPPRFGQRLADIERQRRSIRPLVEKERAPDGGATRQPAQPAAAPPAVDVGARVGRIQTGNAAQEVPRLLAALEDEALRRDAAARIVQKLKARWVRERADRGAEWARSLMALAE